MPKTPIYHDTQLGAVKLPSALKKILDEYCKTHHVKKAVAVRQALCRFLNVTDTEIYIRCVKLRMDENSARTARR
jgi:hypothetical protein